MIKTINEYKAHVDKIYKKLCTFIGKSIMNEEGIITSIMEPELMTYGGETVQYISKIILSTGHMKRYTYTPYIIDVDYTDDTVITMFKNDSGILTLKCI